MQEIKIVTKTVEFVWCGDLLLPVDSLYFCAQEQKDAKQ